MLLSVKIPNILTTSPSGILTYLPRSEFCRDASQRCRRSRGWRRSESPRPAQDILFPQQPQTHRRRTLKATGCYSSTDRNKQKPDIALDFLIKSCLFLYSFSPCIIMFTTCVNVTFSKMYALFLFLPKPLYCASIISSNFC